MKPVNITREDTFEDLREKLIDFMDDYEKKITVINDNIYDFTADEVISHELPSDEVDDLTLTVTDPPTQTEVQAIHDKLVELLQGLRSSIKISAGG